jgi:hypothetical protein
MLIDQNIAMPQTAEVHVVTSAGPQPARAARALQATG